ncbi:hypothetical protein AB0H58_29205 [Nocardia neocaledoniensis]|uniref:hypothetical protein n=1 Tax=Nocardia neocaledoniensis TaxID=236511 RepID=UPI0033E5A6CD
MVAVISFAEAVEMVRARFEPTWSVGTFCLDDREIVENDDFFFINIGAREFIVDENIDFAIAGSVPAVDKGTGRISSVRSVDVAMDPTVRVSVNPNPKFSE